jgi:hypothetical protein
MPGDRPRRREAWIRQGRLLDQVEFERDLHRAFDGGAADLAVPLRSMRVADGKQRARDFDRQEQFAALGDIADVHIAAYAPRGNDAVQARRRRGEADGPGKGFERNSSPTTKKGGRQSVGVVGPDVQRGFTEVLGEQSKAGNVGGPAPSRWAER